MMMCLRRGDEMQTWHCCSESQTSWMERSSIYHSAHKSYHLKDFWLLTFWTYLFKIKRKYLVWLRRWVLELDNLFLSSGMFLRCMIFGNLIVLQLPCLWNEYKQESLFYRVIDACNKCPSWGVCVCARACGIGRRERQILFKFQINQWGSRKWYPPWIRDAQVWDILTVLMCLPPSCFADHRFQHIGQWEVLIWLQKGKPASESFSLLSE